MTYRFASTPALLSAALLLTSACGQSDPASVAAQRRAPAQLAPSEMLPAQSTDAADAAESYLDFFLPESGFTTDVPSPKDFFGFEPGELFLTPETLFAYVNAVADASPRAAVEVIGHTYERRPLTHLYISSPENIANLEEVRRRHIEAATPDDDILVVTLAYSIHGNEPSGSNAAPLIAYYLTASDDPRVEEFLKRTVVIIEPSQNPDGMARYAQWANANWSATLNYDSSQRIHAEPWPGGRTNHYWADLNRDWIFLTHPESRARVREFHRWRPHVLGDYHEMGGDTPTFFFQPGHPKRTHPLTLPENQRITTELAKYHAAAMDTAGQEYFSEENYDDFYYGKGSAYPDINGGLGLLFEQTGSRGFVKDFDGEKHSFRQSVANQTTTSLSLLRGADALRSDLFAYRFSFGEETKKRAGASSIGGYVFGDDGDPARAWALIDILDQHGVAVYELARAVTVDGVKYAPGSAWFVSADAAQYGFVTSLFETRTSFDDNIFYDVSTWNLPSAYNLPYASVARSFAPGERAQRPAMRAAPDLSGSVAAVISWDQLDAPAFLQAMLDKGVLPRVATEPFTAATPGDAETAFDRGSLIVHFNNNETRKIFLDTAARFPALAVAPVSSGLTSQGPDLGSHNVMALRPVTPALVIGAGAKGGVNVSDAGVIWRLLDQGSRTPVTLLELDRVGRTDLSRYTHLLLVDGGYEDLAASKDKIRAWVRAGGVLVAQKRAAAWAQKNLLESEEEETKKEKQPGEKEDAPTERAYRPYDSFDQDRALEETPGSILAATADLTHPFAYGLKRPDIALMRTDSDTIVRSNDDYNTPVRYAETPLLNGYAGETVVKRLAGAPAIAANRLGSGYVVAVSDDLGFRGAWRGSERLYYNILYFSQILKDRSAG
ncbi:MAG: M14 family zinc carboxypeptidase [Amphiplicatus sp.]